MTRPRPSAPIALRAKLFRGLADPSRLGVLEALRDGPLPVGAVVTRTGLSQPSVSMHLACLAECGLVRWRRRGRFVDYEIADKRVVRVLDEAEDLLLGVGPLIECCPRYRRTAPAHPVRPASSPAAAPGNRGKR
jgi:DNA-binding transcriptional ArsR family regulator